MEIKMSYIGIGNWYRTLLEQNTESIRQLLICQAEKGTYKSWNNISSVRTRESIYILV